MKRLLSLLPLLLAACGEPAAPLTPCTGTVNLAVTDTPPYAVSWTPRCGAYELEVSGAPSPGLWSTSWKIRSAESRLAPGIVLGESPAGAQELVRTGAGIFYRHQHIVVVLRGTGGELAVTDVTLQ